MEGFETSRDCRQRNIERYSQKFVDDTPSFSGRFSSNYDNFEVRGAEKYEGHGTKSAARNILLRRNI